MIPVGVHYYYYTSTVNYRKTTGKKEEEVFLLPLAPRAARKQSLTETGRLFGLYFG